MNQSSGSSVQTGIFPPKKKRLYTKYPERHNIMFCLVLGEIPAQRNLFAVSITNEITLGSQLRNAIYKIKENTFTNVDENNLILWKVNIPINKENMSKLDEASRSSREVNIGKDFGGEELFPADEIPEDYRNQQPPEIKTIHIIVQPPPATTVSSMNIIPNEVKTEIKNNVKRAFPHINNFSIGQLIDALALIWNVEAVESNSPSSQNDPCVKLKMEPSFFKINLPSTITEQSRTTVDLCLPPYKSKSGIDYLNPFYDDPQFKDTVSLVKEKLTKHTKDITVLAGVSGGGKTSTAFGISVQNWSIYVDFSRSGGQYGDFMGPELEKIRGRPPEYGQTGEQIKVFGMLDFVIVLRGLLLIKMLVQEKISTPKEWLFAQLRISDISIERIKDALRNVDNISSLLKYIVECLGVESLVLIFDEAQVLCGPQYGEYDGSSKKKKWNLLQAYVEHLTHLPVTCLIAGTYMHMASGISLVTSIGKVAGLHAHIVLKLPFLSQDDVQRNLEAVIDLTDVTSETYKYLIYVLRGRPRNCASFVRKLISERKSTNKTKDEEIRKLIRSWLVDMNFDMADYLENTCKYVNANNLNPEKAIMDVLKLRVFYTQEYRHAIELLRHSVIPCIKPKCITVSHKKTSDKEKINFNPSFESYLISGIEEFFLRRGKTLVDVFVNNIICLNDTSSIGNEFDAVFITAIIQKRRYNVREELNKWKNGQEFDLPSWITPTMKFKTTSNLSRTVPLAEYVNDKIYYRYAIQPDHFSGSDLVLSLMDDEQNVILLSASCTVSKSPIKRKKIKEQLIKSCMKFQYMECSRKKKDPPCLQIALRDIRANNEEDEDDILYDIKEDDSEEDDIEEDDSEEDEDDIEEYDIKEDDSEEDDIEEDDSEEDDIEEDDSEMDDLEEEEYGKDLKFNGVDYDLDYAKNIKKYQISKTSKYAKDHEKIKTLTENRKHIYVSVELPHRQSKRSELFRINKYGDLVIIVDDRNMEYVFGPVIKKLLERISENRENFMDETDE